MKKMYIVIEGQDATGKDTQAKKIAEYFREKGKNVVAYSESGTGSEDSFVKEIARLNFQTKQDINHRTRVLLFLVNRYEQWRKLAEPALRNNDIVITTRSWYSTLIYEGYAGGVSRNLIKKLHKNILPAKYFSPDKQVIFTLSDEDRAKRLSSQALEQGRTGEVMKSQPSEFQQKINAGYYKIAREFNVPTLDASGTIDEVQKNLRALFGV